ncbi:hypothetical protein RDI58_003996 [Solanum bulbocastanum]|uniref:Uncharacterized protein n=1 Tax=Solanum bulbocastanum TaxID=147425 RepID=A0AAN8TYC0_SOLBU
MRGCTQYTTLQYTSEVENVKGEGEWDWPPELLTENTTSHHHVVAAPSSGKTTPNRPSSEQQPATTRNHEVF